MPTYFRTRTTPGAARRASAGATALRWAVRVVVAAYGMMTLAGTAYFTLFASADEGGVSTAGDALVALWSATIGVCLLVAAVRLGERTTSQPLRLAQGAVVALGLRAGQVLRLRRTRGGRLLRVRPDPARAAAPAGAG